MASRLLSVSSPPGDAGKPGTWVMSSDESVAVYTAAMQIPFDLLKQSAAQLAGILVLAAAGSRLASPDHPMMALACQAHEEAVDAIRSVKVPRRGVHHHRHMSQAAKMFGQALVAAGSATTTGGRMDTDAVLPLLRLGWQEMQWTAGALPGFEVVDLDQTCCAHHRG